MEDFVIDQISWHITRTKRKTLHDRAYLHIRTIVEFLQSKDLLQHALLNGQDELDPSFCFRRSDLTDEGFIFIQKYYDKWLESHDHGHEITDTSNLERWLKQMRKKW